MTSPSPSLPLPGTAAGPIAGPLISALSERVQTVAVAESLTGGLICSTLIEVPGASAVVRGGVVSYATDLKHRLLGVDGPLLATNGPVDPEVAAQMALGVRDRLGADWGLSTTGVAGPGPQGQIPPGTVYVGIAGPLTSTDSGESGDYGNPGEQSIGIRVLRLELPGGRAAVRAASAEHAIGALLAVLREDGTGTGAEHGDPGRR